MNRNDLRDVETSFTLKGYC